MKKRIGMIILVIVALSMTACVNLQCAAGQTVNQNMDTDPLIGVALVLVVGIIFCVALIGAAGGGQ